LFSLLTGSTLLRDRARSAVFFPKPLPQRETQKNGRPQETVKNCVPRGTQRRYWFQAIAANWLRALLSTTRTLDICACLHRTVHLSDAGQVITQVIDKKAEKTATNNQSG